MVNTGFYLHLIEPLGFSINDKSLRRAGMDYIKKIDYNLWPDLDTCLNKINYHSVYSISIISGCSGIGKSWLALNLGLSVASGKPFLGFFEVPKPKKVLLIQFELTNGQVKERIKILLKRYQGYSKVIDENFRYVVLDKHITFTDRWIDIQNELKSGHTFGGHKLK